MGAGGRDFHVFNTCYRHSDLHEVVAFTATQIPHIEDRVYPPILAGPRYPVGIAIRPEEELDQIIRRESVDEVVFAYSDVSYEYLETMARRVADAGARLAPFDPESCLLVSSKPCVAVCAVRTGCGKSPLSRYVARRLPRPVIVRHPMPYGDLAEEIVQRFETVEDLQRHRCTIEEMEEYEPHLIDGHLVFAGADYEKILAAAQAEADVIVWDGGNNDAPFVKPDLLITVLDPLRVGDEIDYFPGRWNFEHADVLVIGKIDEASTEAVDSLRRNIDAHNRSAEVIEGRLVIRTDDSHAIGGKRVLVVEDGPTITHGGMAYGAGYLAAQRAGAARIVDPRPHAKGEIADTLARYPHVGPVLPALGYGPAQLADLQATIERVPCDVVVVATPMDLGRVVAIDKPMVRVTYDFEERSGARLDAILRERFASGAG